MNLVSKKWLLELSTRLLLIVIIAKGTSLVLLWLLPGEGVNYQSVSSVQPEYHRYRIDVMLDQGEVASADGKGGYSAPVKKISNLVLKGLYGTKKSGYVVIAMKSSPNKTEVIATGEKFGGYMLAEIHALSAVFKRNNRSYTLFIENSETPAFKVAASESDDLPKQISRDEINAYTGNIDKIWKDISISEVKSEGKIKGFKVTRIKSDSPMARIGLKKGDVIIKANNKELKSYADALDIYKKIGTLQALELVVLRNNQEKEIVYEIY